jgi:peptide-methionine (S)-S-oxide reductase
MTPVSMPISRAILVAALVLGLPLTALQGRAEEATAPLPPPAHDTANAGASETAILAGGCFWGIQGVFQHVRGVNSVVSGYDGGKAATAEYEVVSTGTTGHAESVRITFDPHVVSYGTLLRIFFSVALDPTQVNRQFPDVGSQYRSEVFATTAEQAAIARDYIAELNRAHIFSRPIATKVESDTGFYPAEAYHQDYLIRHPDNAYIATYDLPKIEKLTRLFPDRYQSEPVTVAVAE